MFKFPGLAATLACLAFASSPLAAAPEIAATVYDLKPVAKRILYDQKPGSLKVGNQLWYGDRLQLQPSGLVKLVLVDGSIVKVEGGSELTMEKPVGGLGAVLNLAKGLLRIVAEKQQGRSLQVRTAAGVAGVKGTQFQVEAREGSTEVKVLEGAVDVAAPGAESGVSVATAEAVLSYPDRVDSVRKLSFQETQALRKAFKDIIRKKQLEYSKRVRDAKGKRSAKPEGKP